MSEIALQLNFHNSPSRDLVGRSVQRYEGGHLSFPFGKNTRATYSFWVLRLNLVPIFITLGFCESIKFEWH
jgi:hypothetical protein